MLKRLLAASVIATFIVMPTSAQDLRDLGTGLRILDHLLNQPRRNPGDRLLGPVEDGGRGQTRGNSRNVTEQKSSDWRKIEARLQNLGYDVGSADGRPDEKTVEAIARFQEVNGLDIDGKIGPQTRATLFSKKAVALEFADQEAPSNEQKSGAVAVPDWASADNTPSKESGEPVLAAECTENPGDTTAKICSTEKLLDLKREVDRRYAAAIAAGGAAAGAVQTAHEQWTALLSSCGVDINCIESALSMRLAMLPKVEPVASDTGAANPIKVAVSSGALLGRILPHASEPGSIVGQWEGVAQCAEGRSFYMTLAVERAGGGRFTAEATYVWERYLAAEAAKQIFIGEGISEEGYEFVYQKDNDSNSRVEQHLSKNFSVTFDRQSETLRGAYTDQECISFELTRTTAESKSRVYLVDQDISGPNYYSLQTLAEKCGFFRDYFEMPFSEMKDKDRNEVERSNAGLILLADRYFVPRFGNVVDGLARQEKQRVLSDYTLCQSDPIWKSRLETYEENIGSTVLFWGFQDGVRYQEDLVPPGKADLNFWKMRRARNEVYLAVRQAENEQAPGAVKQLIAIANDKIAYFEALFFPSEIAELKKKLSATDSRSYTAKADAKLEQLAALATGQVRIAEIGRLYDQRSDDLAGSPSDAMKKYESDLTSQQVEAFTGELAPALNLAVTTAANPIPILEQFEKNVDDVTHASGAIIPAAQLEVTRLIAQKRSTLVAEAVQVELETVKGFDPSPEGVRKSAVWVREAEAGFKRYAEMPPVIALWQAVSASREQLLAGAFGAFETELENAVAEDGIAGSKAVAAEYLSWSGDSSLPVSRQYLKAFANAERQGLENAPDGMNRLAQSKEVYDKREVYRTVFSPDEFAAFETAVVTAHESAARTMLFRLLDLNGVSGIEGITKMQQKLEKAAPIFAKMIPDSASRLKNEVQAKTYVVVRDAVKAETARLAGFTADRRGAQASAAWIRDFDARYGTFKNMAEYENGRNQFLAHREKLLTAALPTFEKELEAVAAQNDPAGVDQLVGQYLAWEGDEAFPIALEYQFIAEASK